MLKSDNIDPGAQERIRHRSGRRRGNGGVVDDDASSG